MIAEGDEIAEPFFGGPRVPCFYEKQVKLSDIYDKSGENPRKSKASATYERQAVTSTWLKKTEKYFLSLICMTLV